MAQVQLDGADDIYTAYIQVAAFRTPEDGFFPFTYWLNASYAFGDVSASKISVFVPPRSKVLRVAHQITAAQTGVTAITVGDDDDPNGWIADAYSTGAAGVFVTDYTAAYAATGKYYATADTIDIVQTGVISAGSGKLWIEVLSYFEDLTDT
jgi:hypothetical protein